MKLNRIAALPLAIAALAALLCGCRPAEQAHTASEHSTEACSFDVIEYDENQDKTAAMFDFEQRYGVVLNDPHLKLSGDNGKEYLDVLQSGIEAISADVIKNVAAEYNAHGMRYIITVAAPKYGTVPENSAFTVTGGDVNIQIYTASLQDNYYGGMTVPIVAHELAHTIQHALEWHIDAEDIYSALEHENMGYEYGKNSGDPPDGIFVSKYAMTSAREDFACTIEEMAHHPDKFKKLLQTESYAPLKAKTELINGWLETYYKKDDGL